MPAKAKTSEPYDPGYRCWAKYHVPTLGWIPTDIVAADAADPANPLRWGSLSETKAWLWHGRSFELTPKAASGTIDTMICGWAEIDGQPIDVLPAEDGTTSKLRRTVRYEVVSESKVDPAAQIPQERRAGYRRKFCRFSMSSMV
ncbi:MAG: hypothetical protein SGJ11_14900 [Phycisphaerae bacterium]|nr:hypothetical protein [Phycisphaerae bacterium]